MKTFKEMMEKVKEPTGDLKKACWKGYTAIGMKMKNGRKVPNCVPEEVTLDEMSKLSDALAKIKHDFENPPADHKDAKPAPAKKPEPKKGGGMDYYPDSHGGRRYMGDSVEMDGEMIDELSKATLGSYIKKASGGIKGIAVNAHLAGSATNSDQKKMHWAKALKREKGINKAVDKVTQEETSPKAGKNVVPPTVAALATGGIVKEEEGENKPLGKVMRAGDGKKFKVYVKNAKGNTVKVGFGDPNMEIKRDDPERRKNFRARHNCDSANDRTTPRYWSCRQWRASAKVEA